MSQPAGDGMDGLDPGSESLVRCLWPHRWVLGAGLLVTAGILYASNYDPWPTRNLPAELSMLALFFPLGVLGTAVHVRRRQNGLMKPALRWYTVSFVLRVLFLIVATHYALQKQPTTEGYLVVDSVTFSIAGRLTALALTGKTNGVERAQVRLKSSLTQARETEWYLSNKPQNLVHHSYLLGVFIALCGFSVLGTALPFVALGSFYVVQIWIYLWSRSRPATARWVVLWTALGLEFLCFSAMWHEDLPTAVLLVYCAELLEGPARNRRWRWLLQFGAMLVTALVFRDFLARLFVALAGYDLVRRRIVASRRFSFDLLFLAGIGVMLQHQAALLPYYGQGATQSFVPGLLVNVFALPGPALWFAPDVGASVVILSYLPLSLVWPFVASWLLIGAVLIRQITTRLPAIILLITAIYLLAAAARYPGTYGSLRFRTSIEAILLAIAFEVYANVMERRPESRRGAAAIITLMTLGLFLLNWVLVIGKYAL